MSLNVRQSVTKTNDECFSYIDTNQLIYITNELTCFYIKEALVLNKSTISFSEQLFKLNIYGTSKTCFYLALVTFLEAFKLVLAY